ncbi:MAG: flavodoxin domain-containing protein [Cyclobacteriaceae bacterium]
MKTLIVYYSFSGNNEALAKQLQERLQCDIVKIEETKKRTKLSILWDVIFKRSARIKKITITLFAYDSIILIAPIWAGKIGTPMQSFILQEKRRLGNYSFISLCGGVKRQKGKVREFLEQLIQRKPTATEELWVNDLLPAEKKDKIKYTTAYRVKPDDWKVFDSQIEQFLKVAINSDVSPAAPFQKPELLMTS